MKNLKTYCLALDLVSDPNLIDEYKKHHQNVWPEIIESIKSSGIEQMEIYQLETRLFMIIRAYESFDFSKKAKSDQNNPGEREGFPSHREILYKVAIFYQENAEVLRIISNANRT